MQDFKFHLEITGTKKDPVHWVVCEETGAKAAVASHIVKYERNRPVVSVNFGKTELGNLTLSDAANFAKSAGEWYSAALIWPRLRLEEAVRAMLYRSDHTKKELAERLNIGNSAVSLALPKNAPAKLSLDKLLIYAAALGILPENA